MTILQYAAKQPPRYLAADVLNDLAKKMVFIGGPRQCGKTTLVRTLLSDHFAERGTYLNWGLRIWRRLRWTLRGVVLADLLGRSRAPDGPLLLTVVLLVVMVITRKVNWYQVSRDIRDVSLGESRAATTRD